MPKYVAVVLLYKPIELKLDRVEQKTYALPTCYTFYPPSPSPFVAMVPSQVPQSREPGVILVDSIAPDANGGSGEILFYENVTLALTGGQPTKGRLGLKEDESVTDIRRVDVSMSDHEGSYTAHTATSIPSGNHVTYSYRPRSSVTADYQHQ
jgi:hypothetical protein